MTNILAEKYGFCKPGRARLGKNPKKLPRDLGNLHERVPCDRTYSGRVFPSGDFSIGVVPAPKQRPSDEEYERTRGRMTRQVVRWQENGIDYHEVSYAPKSCVSPPPNLVSGTKLAHRGKYGSKGITGYGKKMVRSGAKILQEEWGLRCTGFGTLTLPSFSPDDMATIAQSWGILVKRFFEEFKREQRRNGGDERYVCVTEIQEARFKDSGELGLHIHFVYKARPTAYSANWFISANWCRHTWRRILANRLGHVCADIPTPRCELKLVRKDAAGYLGKYMSKGGKILEKVKECMPSVALPSQWWGISGDLRRDIKGRIIVCSSGVAAALWRWSESLPSPKEIFFTKSIEISSDVFGIRRVGLVGRGDFRGIKNYVEKLTNGCYVT